MYKPLRFCKTNYYVLVRYNTEFKHLELQLRKLSCASLYEDKKRRLDLLSDSPDYHAKERHHTKPYLSSKNIAGSTNPYFIYTG